MILRLILKEFGPELKYIKGENNAVAYALYRLMVSDNQYILNISDLIQFVIMILPQHRKLILY